jgi:hypothetical protein
MLPGISPMASSCLIAGAKGKICMVDWFIGIMSAPLNESYGLLGHIATNCLAGGGAGELKTQRKKIGLIAQGLV